MSERFLRLQEVIDRTGLSRSSIYARGKLGAFPKHLSLGAQTSAWVESEVQAWIDERIKARDAEQKAA